MDKKKPEEQAFQNRTYYIFPLRIENSAIILNYLEQDPRWLLHSGLKTNYMLCYADAMNDASDERLQCYVVRDPASLPVYMFDDYLKLRMEKLDLPSSGEKAHLSEISMYVFGDGVAFLEMCVDYGGMYLAEIAEFMFRFRSLRNDETIKWLHYPDGTISVESAINSILPENVSGTRLCFSNTSELKRQAVLYSMIHTAECGIQALSEEEAEHYRYLITHGYNMKFFSSATFTNNYEMVAHFREGEYWGGCQDGLACIVEKPYPFQFDHLCDDYHFLYLLLLNQRFAIISYIDRFSEPMDDPELAQELHRNVVTLKLRYSFRNVSDDAFMQTIYNNLYEILEIDRLLKDVDEEGEHLNSLMQRDQAKREKRFENILTVLSVLAVFSALVDLTDYLEKFDGGIITWSTMTGLTVILLIIVIACNIIFKKKK